MQKTLLIILLLITISCKNNNTRTEIPFIKHGTLTITNQLNQEINFDIEIAEDVWAVTQGLMNRYKMEENQGMLFIMETENIQNFWMKNTYISLDMLFINEQLEIVDIHENAFPLSEELILSRYPAKYVFEILGGLSKKLNININDKISYNREN